MFEKDKCFLLKPIIINVRKHQIVLLSIIKCSFFPPESRLLIVDLEPSPEV